MSLLHSGRGDKPLSLLAQWSIPSNQAVLLVPLLGAVVPPLLLYQIRQGNNPNFQFKTHPNIDKAGYSNGLLGLKDPSRPFPTGVRAVDTGVAEHGCTLAAGCCAF